MCAAGLKALRRIQLAKEITHGTAVSTATARLIGTLSMKEDHKYYRPNDLETGKLSDYERSYIISEEMSGAFESDVNFEQLGYLLAMSIKGGVAPTGPTDSAYLWTFKPNLTAANDPNSYTMQYGDDAQAFIAAYCFAKDLEISGTMEEVLKVKANLAGQNMRAGSFTSLSNPTVLTPVSMAAGKLFVDSSWANLGNTNVTGTLVDFIYKVSPGIIPIKYADGAIHFTDRAEKKRHVEAEVTFAFTSGVAGYYTDYIAAPQTHKFIRLEFTGPKIGATTGYDKLQLDGSFVIDDFSTLAEREGQDVVKLKLLSEYDSTGTSEWQILLTNALSALP